MRFRMVENNGRKGVAASRDNQQWHIMFDDEEGFPGSLDDIVRDGAAAWTAAMTAIERGSACDPDEFVALPPFVRAGKILCIGLNYKAHALETGIEIPSYPVVFSRFNTGLVAHEQPLVQPKVSQMLDYEAELAVVIGKTARHVSPENALDYVAGYSLFNDGSVRDYQMRTPQWTIGKNFDGTGGFGPDFVTPDELPAGCRGLRMTGSLNGEIVQDTDISDMIFDVETLISLMSEVMTLEPGDVIATGTPSGIGVALQPPRLLTPGDVFEISVEGIGTLRNPVVAEQ